MGERRRDGFDKGSSRGLERSSEEAEVSPESNSFSPWLSSSTTLQHTHNENGTSAPYFEPKRVSSGNVTALKMERRRKSKTERFDKSKGDEVYSSYEPLKVSVERTAP